MRALRQHSKSMRPLASYKPPPENEKTIRVFEAVYKALNDIDRSVKSPHERRGELIGKYRDVGKRFHDDARECGLSDWLRFTIINREFGITFDDEPIDAVRRLYEEMERLGYPNISPLISVRMIWANRLAAENMIEEAQRVAHLLLADIEEFRRQFPGVLVASFDAALDYFRQRHGV
jgi:hypothetical protein